MRLIRITTNYPTYLKQFYSRHPQLKNQDYKTQYQNLVYDCFGWADFWTQALRPFNYDVWELVANAEILQKKWAEENGLKYKSQNWLIEIITAQVKQFQPDILFVDDHVTFTRDTILHIRHECPSIKLVLGWCGAPYNDKSVFDSYDVVLSNIPELIQEFTRQGHHSKYIKHAFDPRILERINLTQDKAIEFSFFGSIYKGASGHNERESLIKKLIEQLPLEIWSDVASQSLEINRLKVKQLIYDAVQLSAKFDWSNKILSSTPKIRHYVKMEKRPELTDYVDQSIILKAHHPLYGLAMFQKLYESQITFNNHINISGKSASNMRLFESTGVGTCLITDWKENLQDIFELDREVVTYNSVEECIEKVKYLLENPQEIQAIAFAGQKRTLKEHTFTQRAMQLDEIIRAYM
ncbi:CgeB family protein [Microcystis wesenbergii]|uniref:Glycosyltransferase n=1 Tax=Microcystis wesenbergii NRERC-220 TaxID=3068991 RepID=A0ABU3HR75_9CHRO|nr:glycosyltransferase [Microcystis wesenbergii]MDT3676190.1 glycosyltransferase [Microcystis wesenbergii NRERC-220]